MTEIKFYKINKQSGTQISKLKNAWVIFVKIRKFVLMLVWERNAFDCIIIDRPEKLITNEAKQTETTGDDKNNIESSFVPLVTSIMPDITPWEIWGGSPIKSNNLEKGKEIKSSI